MCYMTKCPYVPPHPWNVDFPHLMLRAKAVRAAQGGHQLARTRCSAATDAVGNIAGIPGRGRDRQCRQPQRALGTQAAREGARGRSASAPLPEYHSRSCAQALRRTGRALPAARSASATADTTRPGGAVHHLLWQPQRAGTRRGSGGGLRAQRHRGGAARSRSAAAACPGWSSAISKAVARLKEHNIPQLVARDRLRATTSSRRSPRAC